ncbi:MAG: hypothetical protein M3N82_01300 [Pseudomonadota bacterium]|nr:hypothetical protein [Pseudomonadota bacterium]
MLVLAIPAEKEQSFHAEYDAWCATKGLSNTLANQGAKDFVVHRSSQTTNTSNPMKTWVVVASLANMQSQVGEFLNENPKWMQPL